MQLDRYLAQFPQEQILVIDQHNLRGDRDGSPAYTGRAEGHARAAPDDRPSRDARPCHSRPHACSRSPGAPPEAVPRVSPALREPLTEHLAPEVERLRALTGQAFASWSV